MTQPRALALVTADRARRLAEALAAGDVERAIAVIREHIEAGRKR